jgi:hypothetical protein
MGVAEMVSDEAGGSGRNSLGRNTEVSPRMVLSSGSLGGT